MLSVVAAHRRLTDPGIVDQNVDYPETLARLGDDLVNPTLTRPALLLRAARPPRHIPARTSAGGARLDAAAGGSRYSLMRIGHGRRGHGVRLVVTFHATPGKGAELTQAMKARCEISQQDAGCEQFEVFQSVFDPDKLVLLELWKDQAGA
jgi:hypothetical protein